MQAASQEALQMYIDYSAVVRLMFLFGLCFDLYGCSRFGERGSLEIALTDADSGTPLEGANVELRKLYPGFFNSGSYAEEAYAGVTNQAGIASFEDIIRSTRIGSEIFSAYLRISLPGYISFYQNYAEPLPARFDLKLRKRPLSPTLAQGAFDITGRASSGPWYENEKTDFGFQFASNRYTENLAEADLIVRLKIFPDEESSRPALKSSLLSSYEIIPVDKEGSGSTRGRRVKFAWRMEPGIGGNLALVPQQQINSFQELEECVFQEGTKAIDLFPETLRSSSERTDLFCLKTAHGEVVKFTMTFPKIKWVMQTDGTNRVLSVITDYRLYEF